jgi:hypothetical protein
MAVPAKFEQQGISFSYPENWTEEVEASDSGWTVVIQSPGTAFLSLMLDESMAPPGELADAALDAMQSEYPKLDAEPVVSNLAGRPAVGHDVGFFALDLTNTCRIRAASTAEGTLLILTQATDIEETNLKVLEAICASLKIDDG